MKHVLLAVTLVLITGWFRCQAQETGLKAGAGATNATAVVNAARLTDVPCGGDVFKLAAGSGMSVQRLLGTRATNPLGEDVGEIADVLLDRRGYVTGIVLQVGGFMGIGGQSVTMGPDKMRITSGSGSQAPTVTVFDTRDHILNARDDRGSPGGQ